VQTWLRDRIWILGAIVGGVLLIVHMFWSSDIKIDGVTIGLLAVILLSPYLSLIRRIRFGEIEAEIAPRDVAEVREKVHEASPAQDTQGGGYTESSEHSRYVQGVVDDLLRVVEADPALALAKLRIEIERLLEEMFELQAEPKQPVRRPSGVLGLLRVLSRDGAIDKPTADAVSSITRVLNEAVHGARIERHRAMEVIDSGITLLERLNDIYMQTYERAFEPAEEETIDLREHDSAQSARYRVVTIIPVLPRPKRRTYVMTQTQLDRFLEGYEEYAEYLVPLEPLGDSLEP